MNCTFCGEPTDLLCTKLHLDWIIVLPKEMQPGDVWRSPIDEKLHVVKSTKPFQDGIVMRTKSQHFYIGHLDLPVLVKRAVPCSWPRCEFHCGKCMMYESDARRVALGVEIEESRARELERGRARQVEERRQRAIERRTAKINTPRGETPVRRKKQLR